MKLSQLSTPKIDCLLLNFWDEFHNAVNINYHNPIFSSEEVSLSVGNANRQSNIIVTEINELNPMQKQGVAIILEDQKGDFLYQKSKSNLDITLLLVINGNICEVNLEETKNIFILKQENCSDYEGWYDGIQ